MPMVNKRLRRCVAMICLTALFSVIGHAQDNTALPAQFQQLVSQHQICAAALAVIKARQVQALHFAKGCPDADMPDADSIFSAASLGKPVFAYAALNLVAQGRLNLDTPLLQYLPQGYEHASRPTQGNSAKDMVTDPRLKKVTARMVLQHRSGLPNWASGKLELASDPDTRWQYSGEGYVLLQRAVEAISGMGIDAWMQQQVFSPLAMHHSSYLPVTESQIIPGTDKGKILPASRANRPVVASTLHTTIADYANFAVAVLKNDVAINQILTQPVLADQRSGTQWSLGWALSASAAGPMLWHWGNNPGYRAFVILAPKTGDGMVLLTNSNAGLALAKPLANSILPVPDKLFEFPLLDGGSTGFLCRSLGVC